MKAYANENSLELVGPVYMEYLIDETCTSNPDQYLARYSVAVKK
jgi:effector-binding domain-containing protein